MKKIRAAVVGYGNIGKFSVQALEAAPDFEIAGVVRRQGDKNKPQELAQYEVVDDIKKLKVKLAFVTSKQNKELIEKETGIECHYIPEGIDIADYSKGEYLVDRVGEVYDLGRQHPLYNTAGVSYRQYSADKLARHPCSSQHILKRMQAAPAPDRIDPVCEERYRRPAHPAPKRSTACRETGRCPSRMTEYVFALRIFGTYGFFPSLMTNPSTHFSFFCYFIRI